jgi:hypothetical protein
MITDIGIALTLLFTNRHDRADNAETKARLRLYGTTVGAFAIGGILGVAAYERYGGFLLLAVTVLLSLLALREIKSVRYYD